MTTIGPKLFQRHCNLPIASDPTESHLLLNQLCYFITTMWEKHSTREYTIYQHRYTHWTVATTQTMFWTANRGWPHLKQCTRRFEHLLHSLYSIFLICRCAAVQFEVSHLRDAVSISKHGFGFVVNTDVVENAHRHMLVRVITYRKEEKKTSFPTCVNL